jgi:hypothetical protein
MHRDPIKAREVQQHNAAVRALDNPVKLAQAARIVRVALERKRLTLADLTDDQRTEMAPLTRPTAKVAE